MMNGKKGFTLVEIMIVVAIIGLLAAIAIPSLLKARQETQRKSIVNNLRIISDARDQVLTKSNYLALTSVSAAMVDNELDDGIAGLNWPGDLTTYRMGDASVETLFGSAAATATESNTWVQATPLQVAVELGSGLETITFQR